MKRLLFACAGMLSAAAMTVPAAAQASTTTCRVHGTMYEEDFTQVLKDQIAGNNEIQIFTHPIDLAGGLSGTGVDYERAWGSGVTGDFTSHDDVTFPSLTVTCDDGTTRTGALEINFLATGNYLVNDGAGAFKATFQVVGSSGGLNGVTGQGSMVGVPGVPSGNGDFTGTLHLP